MTTVWKSTKRSAKDSLFCGCASKEKLFGNGVAGSSLEIRSYGTRYDLSRTNQCDAKKSLFP